MKKWWQWYWALVRWSIWYWRGRSDTDKMALRALLRAHCEEGSIHAISTQMLFLLALLVAVLVFMLTGGPIPIRLLAKTPNSTPGAAKWPVTR